MVAGLLGGEALGVEQGGEGLVGPVTGGQSAGDFEGVPDPALGGQRGGVDPRTVMEILGHTTIRQTMDTYGRALPERLRAAAEAMDQALDD